MRVKIRLSERECQVLRGIRQALTYTEIAIELDLGLETVRTHVTRLRKKLGIRTKTGLAIWAARHPRLVGGSAVP